MTPVTPEPDQSPRPIRILIAEDHLDSREALATLLEAFGFVVATAVNGQAAVEQAAASPPDLILMDIMMPVMDGFEAIRQLRQLERTKSIPIVAVTALEGAQELAMQAGATAFVRKPIESRALIELIRSLLGPAGT